MSMFLSGIATTFAFSACIFLFLVWRAPIIEEGRVINADRRSKPRRRQATQRAYVRGSLALRNAS